MNLPMSPVPAKELATRPAATRDFADVLEAERRLRRCGYLVLGFIECRALLEGLELRGRVSSQFLKQVAQAVVLDIPGVHHVINRIEVVTLRDRPRRGHDAADELLLIPNRHLSHSDAPTHGDTTHVRAWPQAERVDCHPR